MALISVVRGLAGVSWLAVFAVIGFLVVRATRRQDTKGMVSLLIVVVILTVGLNAVSAGLVFIEPNEIGVVETIQEGGVKETPLKPGLNWIVPFAENVVTYSISSQTYTMSIAQSEGDIQGDDSIESRTSDGQIVLVDASVIFRIDPTAVVQDIHIRWQGQYVDKLIRPEVRGVIRDAVSLFGIEEVYSTRREELKISIEDQLTVILNQGGLILDSFVLRNIAFSDEYSASVEQKQIAEQLAQQAAFVVDQRKQEAEQARQQAEGLADAAVISAQGKADSLVINATAEAEARLIQAEAESEALRLLGAALAENPDVLTLEYINKLAPSIQVMLLPNDNPFLLPLPEFQNNGLVQ